MFKQLGRILYCTKYGSSTADAVEEFIQIFIDQSAFIEDFKCKWLPKIGIVGSICFLLLFVETLRVCNYISHHCYLHIAHFYLQFAHQDKLIIVEVCLCVMMHL